MVANGGAVTEPAKPRGYSTLRSKGKRRFGNHRPGPANAHLSRQPHPRRRDEPLGVWSGYRGRWNWREWHGSLELPASTNKKRAILQEGSPFGV